MLLLSLIKVCSTFYIDLNYLHYEADFLLFLDTNINEDDSYHENQGSMLYLWTVNGRPVAHTKCDHMISCVDFSRAPEGVSVNVIATGLSNGAIR